MPIIPINYRDISSTVNLLPSLEVENRDIDAKSVTQSFEIYSKGPRAEVDIL